MRLSMAQDENLPYYFCDRCRRLSPVAHGARNHVSCMVCDLMLDPEHMGRCIILNKQEADLRQLPWPEDVK